MKHRDLLRAEHLEDSAPVSRIGMPFLTALLRLFNCVGGSHIVSPLNAVPAAEYGFDICVLHAYEDALRSKAGDWVGQGGSGG